MSISTENRITQINVDEFKQRLENNPKLCIIDVRDEIEWNNGHMPTAIHIAKDHLVEKIAQQVPDKSQAIYLHCQGGMRSNIAAGWLIDAGYTEVYNLQGGIHEWAAKGNAVVR